MGVLFRRPDDGRLYSLIREGDNFGVPELDLCAAPSRFWADDVPPVLVESGIDRRRVEALPSPVELLRAQPPGDTLQAHTRRSLARLHAWFLIYEDPQRRLDAQPVATLAHQASLVHYVVSNPQLERVLIADEVGLGKTVEAGLIIKELLIGQPGMRILYLAPARLVRNVRRELDRLGLHFRQWVAGEDRDATLRDQLVVASIHRASVDSNFEEVVATQPWDVIVVDECHHLSDWERGGGKPVRKYALVRDLVRRQRPGSRLILMSGTPHQGHRYRFENLLELLRRDSHSANNIAGSVIYRTKDDVCDWDGAPLFPARQVNAPVVIDLGREHRLWLTHIHEFYVPPRTDGEDRGGVRRAAGWRCAQALQWATSSVQAGLGYLVRQAIRAGWGVEHPALGNALAAVRPYRLGPEAEPIDVLFGRIRREVQRQMVDRDLEDIEDAEENQPTWVPDPEQLSNLLDEGVALVERVADRKWQLIYEQLLAPAGVEKVVLFAQPIETVTALSRFLQRRTGRAPALIIGNQDEGEREDAVNSFWRPEGPQFLVSSRAGGEGINLQIANRLVHVDVPWNPMELEQRVGRVHRFGSRKTIIVDTVVARASREIHAYRVAREKLAEIASSLVPGDRFESLYSRVMALVPPEDLQSILGESPLAPLTGDEQRRIAELVSEGFQNWQEFHNRFSEQQERIRQLDPGQATWDDVADFAKRFLKAEPMEGFTALRFLSREGEIQTDSTDAEVFALPGGRRFACGDYSGMPISGPDSEPVDILGLNRPEVATELRKLALPDKDTGAAHLRWPVDVSLPSGVAELPFAVWVAARQSLRRTESGPVEIGGSLVVFMVTGEGETLSIDGREKGQAIRNLLRSTIRREPELAPDLLARLSELESEWVHKLRIPSETDREQRVVHAAWPLFAAVVS